ncbi:MAG TPA: FUSC family protein, partial [Candidatus Dormibacteraeota bacterium]|nr:FUSC family protein [Candidatus Dormibacteraeota bacterium]
GGYVAAGQTGMLLAFVIAVSIPASVSTIPARVEGWVLAGVISTLAGVFLWPRFERVMLHKHAAKACLSIANLVEGLRATSVDLDRLIAAARQAEQRARQQYAATAKRPAGPTRRDRAFVELLTELQRTVDIIERPFSQARPRLRPEIEEGARLTATVVAAFKASGEVLTGGGPPDLRAVDEARAAHRAALDRWAAAQLRAGRPVDEVLDGLDVDHTLRVVSYLAIALGSNAIIAAGRRLDVAVPLPASSPRREGAGGVAVRVFRTIRTHLTPTSTVLQNSLRAGIGLGLAVLIARLFGLSHSFWVVLGTVQVLRSNALGTGRSSIAALAGNVIGVAIGGLFAFLAGNHPAIMWAALPVVVFGAAYAATAIGFGASQAAFTINLIVVFNLISPAGWQIGLVRIEDLVVGAGISLVVGLLLWPRGARRELARAVGGYYRALVAYLDIAFDRILAIEPPGRVEPVRRSALEARDRAGEAFDSFLNERAGGMLDPQTAGVLLSSGNHALLAGEALEVVSSGLGYRADGCPDGARAVHAQVRLLLNGFLQLAAQLRLADANRPRERVSSESLRGAALDCLRRWRNDERVGRGALAVVIAGEWAQNLARMEEDLERPVAIAAQSARLPWWR